MKKIQILGFAMFAMFALSAIAATSAFAEPEWLVETLKVTETLPAETEGLLNLIALENNTPLNEINCEGILDGTIGPPLASNPGVGTDEITAVLSLNQETISSTPLSGLALGCLVTQSAGGLGDCTVNSLAAVWPLNLPWSTELELMTAAPIWLNRLFKLPSSGPQPGWYTSCASNIGTSELQCEGPSSASLSNESLSSPASVLGEFSIAAGSEKTVCNISGITGDVEGPGNTWAIGAELVRLTTAIS
jgi:hypothetical protein